MNFGKPPSFKKPPKLPITNVDHSSDTLHELKQQIGRRRTSLYSNPGEKLVNETDKPNYFHGIKRILRTRYGGSGQ